MGWFWDAKPSQNSHSSSNTSGDAYSKLDTGLRNFLDKEAPSQHSNEQGRSQPRQPAPSSSSDSAPNTYRTQLGLDIPGLSQEHQNPIPREDRAGVPAESLFQDGRYAHLWKSYRPQSEIDAAGKTDQDRLADIVEVYRDRKAAIGRAALENCIMEQLAEKDCYAHGGLKKMMTMCRQENREFNRCFTMQSRFLKALGYLSNQHGSVEDEERIQMHADRLFHEMLAREKVAEEAKKAGQAVPAFEPLLQPDLTTQALGENSAYARARQRAQSEMLPTNLSAYTPEKQDEIKDRLKGLNEVQREVELQLIAAESRAQLEYADQVKERLEEERVHRAQRRERGKETFGDTIKRWWGWQQ